MNEATLRTTQQPPSHGARPSAAARRRSAFIALGAALASLHAVACDSDGPAKQQGKAKPPVTVDVAGGSLASGFVQDATHESASVTGFRITKHPITRGQYAACTRTGSCTALGEGAGECTSEALEGLRGHTVDDKKSPVTCLTTEQAAQYCGWIGGRLPHLAEWLLAARGSAPQHYAWGESTPTCEQNPRAADGRAGMPRQDGEGCDSAGGPPLIVGEHTAGAAASGMEDVMITPAELLAADPESDFSACRTGAAGCIVYGSTPAAMDAVFPVASKGASRTDVAHSPHVYGFRCVLEES